MQDDTISLADMLLTLYRRKWLFVIVLGLSLLVGTLLVITKHDKYRMTQQFSLPAYVAASNVGVIWAPIMPAEVSTENMLENTVIPTLRKDDPEIASKITRVKLGQQKTNLQGKLYMELEAEIPLAEAKSYEAVFQQVIEQLNRYQAPFITEFLHVSHLRLETLQTMYNKLQTHAAGVETLFKQLMEKRGKAQTTTEFAGQYIISHNATKVPDLIGLYLADSNYQTQVSTLKTDIDKLQNMLQTVKTTTIPVSAVMVSVGPIGVTKLLLAVIVVIFSILLGLIVVFVTETLSAGIRKSVHEIKQGVKS